MCIWFIQQDNIYFIRVQNAKNTKPLKVSAPLRDYVSRSVFTLWQYYKFAVFISYHFSFIDFQDSMKIFAKRLDLKFREKCVA